MEARAGNQKLWFRQLIDSTVDPVIVVSTNSGRLVDVNSAFWSVTGLSPREVIGKTPFESGFFTDRAAFDLILENASSPVAYQGEFHVRGGGVRIVQPTIMNIDVARQHCLMIIWHDISKQKEIERTLELARDDALEASQIKTRFLANTSHEIRTPLTAILGMSQLLCRTSLSGQQREFADAIVEGSTTLLRVVNDVLDFSKAVNHGVRLDSKPFEIRMQVESAVALFRASAKKKRIALRSTIDSSIPKMVSGDADRLKQVLVNLINNAVKFTERGQVRVSATMIDSSEDAVAIRFEVADSGIGIRAEDQPRLFQPFVQADNSSTRNYGGTGLGLAICAKLVELMSGEIGLQSTQGDGSIFFFTARFCRASDTVAEADRDSAAAKHSVANEQLEAAEHVRILLVEDNPLTQLVVQRQLEKLGCKNIEIASNGIEAVDAAAKSQYDLVLMDCQMPKMDGREATAQIRRLELGKRRTPIIAVTANAFEQDRNDCLAAGMDEYLAKPITLEELRDMVAKFTRSLNGQEQSRHAVSWATC